LGFRIWRGLGRARWRGCSFIVGIIEVGPWGR
jgi:hypothetical protein